MMILCKASSVEFTSDSDEDKASVWHVHSPIPQIPDSRRICAIMDGHEMEAFIEFLKSKSKEH